MYFLVKIKIYIEYIDNHTLEIVLWSRFVCHDDYGKGHYPIRA